MRLGESSQTAEQVILDALKSDSPTLNLSGLVTEDALYALMDLISQFEHLRALDLSHNSLSSVPNSLFRITELQSLNLANNDLPAVPRHISSLQCLTNLNLAGNSLRTLRGVLGDIPSLKTLDLSSNQLTDLPGALSNLTQLGTLGISDNPLKNLPLVIAKLSSLQNLTLAQGSIRQLPDWIGGLTELLVLDLHRNNLSMLPRSLVNCRILRRLNLYSNNFAHLPRWLGELVEMEILGIGNNPIGDLPQSLSKCTKLRELSLGDGAGGCPLGSLPHVIRKLESLMDLSVSDCGIRAIPEWVGELSHLELIRLDNNKISDLPASMSKLSKLQHIDISDNPLNPELRAAYTEGFESVLRYLRAKGASQVTLNEAKLILIGEGEVGKSCLLGAMRGDPWMEGRDSTHGIEIKPVRVISPQNGSEIKLNGWDFGGQKVYRPTHQLFFSSPAIYLLAWKPREGPQQGFVKDWIKLVKHREPDAKIVIVATHGGPKERQPDIDRQDIWDTFGKETVIDFFHVNSRPNEVDAVTGVRFGECDGIESLKATVASIACDLPEMGRSFPAQWQAARDALTEINEAYLPLERIFDICASLGIDEEDTRLLLRICRRVGDLIHYEHDPVLRHLVVLKPDWLATAISYVLDDKDTRDRGHGLVSFSRLGQLWSDPARDEATQYPTELHPVFLRLMERFDISYRVAERVGDQGDHTSLVAQLVPDIRPDLSLVWPAERPVGEEQQVQICRIVDESKSQTASAEGLFYQLIVRLHKFSLGRANYAASVHWQRGLVLEDDTGSKAFLEHIDNDVRITVRSPYPERFLAFLTYEVKWLVENFWSGLRCEVTVPCLTVQEGLNPCSGLFEVSKLMENKRRGRPEQPCSICNEWHGIEELLHNAPGSRPSPLNELVSNLSATMDMLQEIRRQLSEQQSQIIGRFDSLDATSRELVGKVEDAYAGLMRTLTDEATEGPRLFSFEPVDPGFLDAPAWASAKFRLTLWCEHSRLPLPALNGPKSSNGVYDLALPREWLVKSAPFLKLLITTLSLVIPVASSSAALVMDDDSYKNIEKQLKLGEKSIEAALKGGDKLETWIDKTVPLGADFGQLLSAEGAILRELHSWLKGKDPGFGGLVRVQNKRQEFLWVHSRFESEY